MLASRIVFLRRSCGMSQLQLAQRLHISASAEGMYEQGRRTPSLELLVAMSQIFGVSLDYLITGFEFNPGTLGFTNQVIDVCPCCICCCKREHILAYHREPP